MAVGVRELLVLLEVCGHQDPRVPPDQQALPDKVDVGPDSDIPLTETQTDTEMIDISKTDTETNTEKIFNTDTIYI